MACLRASLKQTTEEAYAHHIQRLMITGNFAMLAGVDPKEVHEWKLDVNIDAHEWVELPNTLGMSQFADGGLMSTKPYISGSNYILKMSDYKKGKWSGIWDALYWEFINSNRDFFLNNPRMAMRISMYDKKTKDMKSQYSKIYRDYQSSINKYL